MNQVSLHNRNDVAHLLLDILRPLKSHFSQGHGWLHVGDTGVHYGEKASRMEGFARILWGLGPLWAGLDGLDRQVQEEANEWLVWYRAGIINGTNPNHHEYWGDVQDYDQKMVEMAALVTAIALSPEKLWESLSLEERDHLYIWLNQINEKSVHPNNWRYFRILVNMTFRLLGLPWSEVCMEDDRKVIEACYTGDGWYYDGNEGQVDYYIPFAMHFYGLIYGKLMKEEEPEYCEQLKKRASDFSKDFIYWFAEDGTEIPYGRSLTYRFAHSAFFSAWGFCGADGITPGIARTLVLRNLEQWINRPIFSSDGILSIGYGYPNLFMSERYNGPGSPYWGLKTFFLLAIPDTDVFWKSPEEIPAYESSKYLSHPHMLITHDKNNHVLAYPAGQHCRNHGHCPEKYEKFVYSNQFGFSISREDGLNEGAFDSTLAVSMWGDNHYRMRYGVESYEVTEDRVCMEYNIMPGVYIKSVIVPCGPWHVRIHTIRTTHKIDIADGGFSIEADSCFQVISGRESGKYKQEQIKQTEQSIFAELPTGISGVYSYSNGKPELVECFPNTNLLYNLTVLPTILKTLEPGEHVMITAVFGDRSDQREKTKMEIPQVQNKDDTFIITWEGKQVVV